MLRGIRKASSNWLGKTIMATVMGILIVSFAVWGIADIFRGFGQSALAKIGSTEISTDQFRQLYNDRLQQIGRQFGRPLTQDQARAFGLDRQVLQQVIAEASLDEAARRMGLAQSDAETMRLIVSDPNFRGAAGNFDPNRFQQTIRQYGYNEQRYIAEQRKIGLRRQIADTIIAGLAPPRTMLDALVRFQGEQRSIDFATLTAAQAGAIDPPSPEMLATYFDERKSQFRAPEYRKISYVLLTPDAVGKWLTVSDDDAQKVFEQRRAALGTPEQREVEQMIFPTMDDAAAARARITAGTPFEDVAKERNLSAADINLGLLAKSAMVDPAIAEAAFALPSGGVSEPVQGRFGVALVKVGKIEPGVEASYAAVADTLKRELAAERARSEVNDLHNKMEDERGGGSSVIDAAQKLGLTPVTIEAVDRSGRTPQGQAVAGIPQGLNVVAQAFTGDVGVEAEAISFGGGYVYYDVLGVTPSRDRNLDEVKAEVETRWTNDQIAAKLKTRATDMVQAIAGGKTLADEAAAAGVRVDAIKDFKRDATLPGLPAGVVQVAFRTARDQPAQTGGNPGEWVVLQVTGVTEPPVDLASEDVKKLKDTLDRALSDEQIAQYVARLESQIGVNVNQAAFAQATGAASSN